MLVCFCFYVLLYTIIQNGGAVVYNCKGFLLDSFSRMGYTCSSTGKNPPTTTLPNTTPYFTLYTQLKTHPTIPHYPTTSNILPNSSPQSTNPLLPLNTSPPKSLPKPSNLRNVYETHNIYSTQ